MRAIFHPFESINENEILIISGDAAHHLNVVRVKTGESILILNGQGVKLSAEVKVITKTQVEIFIVSKEVLKRSHELSLAIANPKKDAFEDILKMAVELGVKDIYPMSSDFSQYDYVDSERVQRILESALIQSNNPFFPVIHEQVKLSEFLDTHPDMLVFFNSRLSEGPALDLKDQHKKTILIGPEGGFSPSEVASILKFSKICEIHLPTPILRAPTAVASSVGYLLARQNS